MTKAVVITGASGFLGRHVARDWAAAGYRVLGIGRDDWEDPEWRAWGLAEWFCGDVTVANLGRFGILPEVLVHCAGSGAVGFSYADPAEDFARTVGTLLEALEFIRQKCQGARLVYPSSAAVYGLVQALPILETAPLRPASPYGNHKLIAELLCQSYARHFGLNLAVVRLFSLYGPNLRKQLLWDACRKFAAGQATFPGTGEEVRDWVHVTDAARLLRTAADHASPECALVNGASGNGSSVREVLTLLRAAFPEAVPLSFTGEVKAGDPKAYVGDERRALAWGWRPSVPLAEGIESYAHWFLENPC